MVVLFLVVLAAVIRVEVVSLFFGLFVVEGESGEHVGGEIEGRLCDG